MARKQDPWDQLEPVRVRGVDPRQNEREQAETRYRNTTGDRNPLARPVILPGEQDYAGSGSFLPEAGVVVRNQPWEALEAVPIPGVAEERAVEALGSVGALNVPGAYTPFMRSALEQAPFGDEIVAGIASLGSGQSYGDIRRAQRQIADYDRQNYSTDRNLGGVAGFAAGLAAPGGAYIRGAQGLRQVGRAAAVGGAYGGAYGAGAAEDDYASRLSGLGGGALVGALGGAGVQRGAQAVAASGVGQRLASIAGIGTRPDPEVVAARRLTRTITDPDAAIAERTRLQALGLEPSLMDVTGGTTERAVRAAAGPAGPGAEAAVGNMVARQANLKPEVMGVTRGLSDDPRSATAVREGLEATRGTLADQQYAPAYAERVVVDDQTLRALSDEPGRAALRRARAAAVARQNDTQVGEIDRLLAVRSPRSDVTVERRYGDNFAIRRGGEEVGDISIMRRPEGVFDDRVQIRDEYRGQGIGSAAYDAVEREIGAPISPSPLGLSEDASRMWASRLARLPDAQDRLNASESIGRGFNIPDVDIQSRIGPLRDVQPIEVSAGTLDRVRIAMAGRAQAMQQRPDTRDIASGLFGRAGQIDNALEAVPGLAPARETYRNLSGAMEAIDNASQVFNTDPRDFAQIVRELTPEQRQAMVIGVRQEIMDTLGGQRAAGTGSLQTLSEAPYARQNLEALLGAEEAARYIGSIRARVEQAQRAARVSPSTNSQTFGRAQDEAAVNAVEVVSAALDGFQTAGGNALAGARTANRLSNFVAARTMTPEVRAAIVDLGIGSADELERVLELGSTARAANRPPPREVRAYLAKVQGQLGAQNPVTVRLEQLLLPSRVSAEEEAQ